MIPILQGIAAVQSILSLGRSLAGDPSATGATFTPVTRSGSGAPDGRFEFARMNQPDQARLANAITGQPIELTLLGGTRIHGPAGAVELSAGELQLVVGGARVPFRDIRSLLVLPNAA